MTRTKVCEACEKPFEFDAKRPNHKYDPDICPECARNIRAALSSGAPRGQRVVGSRRGPKGVTLRYEVAQLGERERCVGVL
jgi:hypothetical protein